MRQNNTFLFEEVPFAKNAQRIGKTFHEIISILMFLHRKPQVKSMIIFLFHIVLYCYKKYDGSVEKWGFG